MNRTLKIYIVFLVLLIIGISFIDANRPRPVNWSPTYAISDKIPLGLYVFDKESGALFKDSKIEKINITPYEFFTTNYDYEDTINSGYSKEGTFLYIDEFSKLDPKSVEELLNYVSYGNKAFISTKDFPRTLLDSLHLNLNTEFSSNSKIYNSTINTKEFQLDEGISYSYFDKIDTLQTTVLGHVKKDTAKVNFIKVNYYDGEVYLHNQPAAFTNFHLLKNDHYKYAENVLSHLPKGNIYWYTKEQSVGSISASPMRYILSQPALKWAWWLFLLGMIVFMIFNAKRKQRIVPIIKPLTNTTVEFIKTIGNLYLQEGNHGDLINKKIIYFLEKIRNEYLIDTTVLDENFIKKLHQKSGKSTEEIEKVVQLIHQNRSNKNQPTESDLIQLTKAIETVILN